MMLNSRKSEPAPASNGVHVDRSYTTPAYAQAGSSGAAFNGGDDTGPSIVNKQLTMKGDLESDGDILVKGKVLGNIRCKLLIIDVEAFVDGELDAEEIVVRGKTKGKLRANRVKLEKTATVESEIEHHVFSAEEGARIKGAMKFMEEPMSRTVRDGLTLVA